MTREEREEAIKVIKNFPVESTGERKAVLTAIEALEQEPCEDAISRQAVCDYIAEFVNNEYSSQAECEMVDAMIEGIQHLPPVNPQEPKTGYCKECNLQLQEYITKMDEVRRAYDNISKAEPCEDCISRQAVLDINESHHGQMPNHINHQIWQEIKELPPVNPLAKDYNTIYYTPQPKTGRWIKISPAGIYECSECGQNVMTSDICAYKFCHGCSAKMVDPQESEG